MINQSKTFKVTDAKGKRFKLKAKNHDDAEVGLKKLYGKDITYPIKFDNDLPSRKVKK